MPFNRKQVILMLIPLIAITFSMPVLFHVSFKAALSPVEQEALRFSYKKSAVILKQPVTVTHLKSPIELPAAAQKDFPRMPLSEIFREIKKEKKILLILINDNRKMAIINDIVVKEGDMIDHSRVKKIEKNRVLIKDKEGEEWIELQR